MLGPDEERYLERVVERLRDVLGRGLAAAYLTGSGALGDWTRERSDLDVLVVCDAPLDPGTKARVADALWHSSLPCPVRGLELVVYDRATVREGDARFEVNLNTGPG